MKKFLELEIEKSLLKISNLRWNTIQIASKIDRLEKELQKFNVAIQEEEERLYSLGLKSETKVPGQTDTEAQRVKKARYNSELQIQKNNYIQQSQNINEDAKRWLQEVIMSSKNREF